MVDDVHLVIRRAAALIEAERPEQALAQLAPHLASGDVMVMALAAKAELDLENYDQAQRLAEQAVVSAPDDYTALRTLAEVLIERRFRKEVRGVLTTMIRIAPEAADPSSLWVLADMRAGLLDDTTEEHARRAVALDPSNPKCVQVLALVLFHRGGRGRIAQAREMTEYAARQAPHSELTALTMAELAEKKRNMLPTIRVGAGKIRSDPTASNFMLIYGVLRALSYAFVAQILASLVMHRFAAVGTVAGSAVPAPDRGSDVTISVVMALVAVGVIVTGTLLLRKLGPDRRVVLAVAARSKPVLAVVALQVIALVLEVLMIFVPHPVVADLLFGTVLVCAAGVGVCVVAIRFRNVGATARR